MSGSRSLAASAPGRMGDIPARVLVVEDEESIADIVATALRHRGFETELVADGGTGLLRARERAFDLLVLDVMLPGLDGFEVCRRLREQGDRTPVLFLTARDQVQDRIRGFVTGADDYLTKPFDVDELVLRAAAILRRTAPEPADALLRVGDLTLDPAGHVVRRGGRVIDLSAREFALLHYLMVNAGVVVSKASILLNVWPQDFDGSDNIVEIYIGYLRRKLTESGGGTGATDEPLLHTKRGAGYVLRAD